MATYFEQTPDLYTPIGNPIMFVTTDVTATPSGWLYVLDVIFNGNQIARFKSAPDPSTLQGYFNIREILRNLVSLDADKDLDNASDYNRHMSIAYEVELYNEIDGTLSALQDSWIGHTYLSSIPVFDFPQFSMSDYVADGAGDFLVKALATWSERKTIQSQLDHGWLYFMSQTLSIPTIDGIRYKYYLEDGTLLRSYSMKTAVFFDHTLSEENQFDCFRIPAGFRNIQNIPSSVTSDGLNGDSDLNLEPNSYITIQGEISFDSEEYATELYTIRISDECIQTDVTEIYFQNSLGGIDTYQFTKPNRETNTITRTESSKPLLVRSASAYGYAQTDSSRFISDVKWSKEFQVQSNWLTDDEFQWLQQLVTSPNVWVKIDSFMTPIIITNSSYQVFKRDFDQLKNLTISYKFTIDQTIPL